MKEISIIDSSTFCGAKNFKIEKFFVPIFIDKILDSLLIFPFPFLSSLSAFSVYEIINLLFQHPRALSDRKNGTFSSIHQVKSC